MNPQDPPRPAAGRAGGELSGRDDAETGGDGVGEAGGDPRFTLGLVVQLDEVLIAHGYPPRDGPGLLALMQALFVVLHPQP